MRKLLALVVVVVVLVLAANSILVVRQVNVEGADELTESEITQLSSIFYGKKMFSIKESDFRSAIESGGQYILDSMTKQYPSTIKLTLHKRSVKAFTIQGNYVLCIDTDGVILETRSDIPPNIPYISGLNLSRFTVGETIDTDESNLVLIRTLLEALEEAELNHRVYEINVESSESILLTTYDRLTVKLGNTESLAQKLELLKGTLDDMAARNESGGTLEFFGATKVIYTP